MKESLKLALGGVFLAGSVFAGDLPDADRLAGQKVAGMCRTCHGLDGYARIPIAPHIGGEPFEYLAAQLEAFRSGIREHEMMSLVARGLTDRQISDVSAWYAGHLASASHQSNADDAPELCVACHGTDGISLVDDAPNLAGETNVYIEIQLKAFRSGSRVHEVMTEIAAGLTDGEIREFADWYATAKYVIDQVDAH